MLVPALELLNITKHFDDNEALNNASLCVASGSIHGIVGENGAGKSTLMQIAYGLEQPDRGSVMVDGATIVLDCPQTAIRHGVGMLHQKVSWLDQLSILENIVLGDKIDSYIYQTNRDAKRELLQLNREFGFEFSLDQLMVDLSYSQRQQVDILRALYRGVRVLILDEPMALLSAAESQHLFDLFLLLKAQGISVIVVSHKLVALHHICDVISVIKRGRVITSIEPKDVDVGAITKLMVGREIIMPLPKKTNDASAHEVLAITKLNCNGRNKGKGKGKLFPLEVLLSNIELTVNSGQIMAIVGLPNAGQDVLLDIIAGVSHFDSGEFSLSGHQVDALANFDISQARRLGVGYVPDSMLGLGFISEFTMAESAILGCLAKKGSFWGRLNRRETLDHCAQLMKGWDVRPINPGMKSGYFSAGNQQKMVLAREITQQPKLLLLNQPTQGVDIGGIALIYQRLFELRERGSAILLVSHDLDEVISLADFVVIMHQGRIVKQLNKSQLTKQRLRLLMTDGVSDE
jgi:simple sugar transport system ATP-binding protein